MPLTKTKDKTKAPEPKAEKPKAKEKKPFVPAVGKICIYHAQDHEKFGGVEEHPAIITAVGDCHVSVKVLFKDGPCLDRASVPFLKDNHIGYDELPAPSDEEE